MTDTKKRILILGGGFSGVYVAVHLGKFLSKKEREEIEIRPGQPGELHRFPTAPA
jgi:NADH dehydrogenase FAD-containing subunit